MDSRLASEDENALLYLDIVFLWYLERYIIMLAESTVMLQYVATYATCIVLKIMLA